MKKAKKLMGLLLAVCMLLSIVPVVVSAAAAGDTFTDGNFTYKVNTDTSTVTLSAIAVSALSGAVTVPGTVTDGTSAYTVTQLGDAFKNQGTKTSGMTALTLPDTITKFTGTATFYACKFTSIHLPTNLTGDSTTKQLTNTFYYCSNLASVTLPAGITKCYGTFRNSAVKTVTITGMAAVDFFGSSGTSDARAWLDGTTGIKIYYPYGGTAPTRTGTSFTATVIQQDPVYEPFTYGDFTYKQNGETTVTLTAIAASALTGAVTVPSTVSDGVNTYTVTKLGDAFKNQSSKTSGMTGLTLPDTITRFTGTATFYACKFTSIHLPANLEGDATAAQLTNTFYYCTNLTSVTLPAGITKCYGTFRNSAVRTVTITGTSAVDFYGSSGTSDARAWLDGTTGITIYYPYGGTAPTRTGTSFTATVVMQMPTFTYGDFKYKLNTDGTTVALTGVSAANLSGDVTVPSTVTYEGNSYTVTTIGAQAFNGKTQVTSITLPNTITTLGYQAFMDVDSMVEFEMPDSVTTIGYGLFYGCGNLVRVKLSKNLTGTMQTTFAYCPKLDGCVIPEGVTTLNKTFMYCNIIKTVVIPSSVTVITGDDNSDIRNRLFSTFNTEERITGAPTEPGFVVMGAANSMAETYMNTKGWNFKVIDPDMPLEVTDPKPDSEEDTVTINVVNRAKTALSDNLYVFCAYYDKTDGSLIDSGIATLNGVDALDYEKVIIEMNETYDPETVYAKSFVWGRSSLDPFAGCGKLYEIVAGEL